jgi:hypothetical protein
VLRDESRLARPEALDARARSAGWCLGVLAAAHGLDLLRARHEAEGLRWMVALLAEARGWSLRPRSARFPRLAGCAAAHWEICLLAAWCVLRAGTGSRGVVRWHAEKRDRELSLGFELGPERAVLDAPSLPGGEVGQPRIELVRDRLLLSWR